MRWALTTLKPPQLPGGGPAGRRESMIGSCSGDRKGCRYQPSACQEREPIQSVCAISRCKSVLQKPEQLILAQCQIILAFVRSRVPLALVRVVAPAGALGIASSSISVQSLAARFGLPRV